MDFKTRRIRKEPKRPSSFSPKAVSEKIQKLKPPKQESSKKSRQLNIHTVTILGSLALLIILLGGIFYIVKSLDFSAIVFSFGKTLQTDEVGKTNFLLVGVGGEGHDGASLTDTIIVASLNYDNKIVPMMSIPRDLFIDSDVGNQKINSIYALARNQYGESEGMYYLKDKITELTGIPIQYYVKVNFSGFEKIVDSLGGIDIDVENAIYDPYYPKGETIYFETFQISAGPQHIDGATALKYARSRKTTSDFDRAKRQQQLLYAIKDKALSLNVLTDPGKISSLYNSVADSIETNLSLTEIIELAKLSKDFHKDDVFPIVLNDDPTSCGGILYTPVREYFGGASVLLPAGNNFDYLHEFVSTTFDNIQPIAKGEKIQVLNGTKTPGLAWTVLESLSRFCLNVDYYGNASNRDLDTSTIFYQPDEEGNPPEALNLVNQFIQAPNIAGIPPEYLDSEKRQDSVIVIELGRDYAQNQIPDPFDSLKYTIPLTPPESEEETVETDTTETSDSTTETTLTTEEEAPTE